MLRKHMYNETCKMTPELIEALNTIKEKNGFTSSAELSISETVSNDISSSVKVKIKENSRELHLFVKFLTPDQTNAYGADSSIYFNNEIVFYDEILRQFEDLSSVAANNNLTCAPKCIRIGRGDVGVPPFIIMEDLVAIGYTPLDVKQPLSVGSARLVLQQLGQFHAYSFAMKDQRPQRLDDATSKLQETVFREDKRQTYGRLFTHSMHDAYKLAKQSLPPNSIYVDTFGSFVLNIYDKISSLAQSDDTDDVDYKVVTHGDLWLNNILCRRDAENDEVSSVVFVDFQGCRYASPVHDLMAVMFTGLDKTSRDLHRDELIQCYHTSLCRTLQEFGSDPLRLFPYSALQNQILKHTQFALSLALAGLPLFLNENLNSSLDSRKEGQNADGLQEFLRRVRESKSMKCKSKMMELIMEAVDQGYI